MRPLAALRHALFTGTLLAALPAVAGEPVLVPDVTPGTTTEFAIGFMLQDLLIQEMEREGHVVLTAPAVRPVVGDALDACADVAGCPFAPLQQLPARVAVVIRVLRTDAGLHAEVKFYDQADSKPVEVRNYLVQAGAEGEFARNVSAVTTDILALVGGASADDIRRAVQLVDDAEEAAAKEAALQQGPALDPPPPGPLPKPPEPKPEVDISTLSFERRLEDTGVYPRHVAGSRRSFMESNLDPRDWSYKAKPHAGRVVIEVRGGFGIGDTDRESDVRVVIGDDDDAVQSEWLQEGAVYAERLRGALFVGYAPVTFLDVGAYVGLQYSEKVLSTGWRRESNPEFSSGTADPVQAVMLLLQPRVRGYIVPTGFIKPYVFAGGELRLFDDYHIIDPEDPAIDYPDPPGGVVYGATGGGGLMIDVGPIVGFFAEGAYTQHFGLRSQPAERADPDGFKPADAPNPDDPRLYTVAIEVGVQFRL